LRFLAVIIFCVFFYLDNLTFVSLLDWTVDSDHLLQRHCRVGACLLAARISGLTSRRVF